MRITPQKNFLLGILLYITVLSSLMLIYRGWQMSGDEIFTYDSVESLVNRGDIHRTYEFNTVLVPGRGIVIEDGDAPWQSALQEPLMFFLVAPLFWIAQRIPQVGTMHIVWLFNSIVLALTAVSIYVIALRWKYAPMIGFALGIIYALATNMTFYGRLLFREPVMAFFILWAFALAFELQQAWREWRIPYRKIVILGLAFIAAFLTKAVAVFLLPGLVIAALPPLEIMKQRRRFFMIGAGVTVLLMIAGIFIIQSGILGARYDFASFTSARDRFRWKFVWESLLGYQVSFGRSLWLYSPVLAMGIVGAVLWWRDGRWRLVIAPMMGVVLLSLWYGFSLRFDWLGGWGWGPRYLTPLIPVLLLWMLPVFEKLTTRTRQIMFWGVVALSAGVQFLSMAVPLSNFYTDLFAAGKIYDFNLAFSNPTLLEDEWGWMDQMWRWEWSQPHYHLQHLDLAHLDIAWYSASPSWVAPLLAVLALAIALGGIGWYFRKRADRLRWLYIALAGSVIMLVASIITGMLSLRDDPRYIGEWDDVKALVDALNTQVDGSDALFIDRHLYTPLFMNYFKVPALVATLPYAPGENYAGTPAVISDDPVALIGWQALYALNWTADHYEHLWLVASASPFETDKIRPIERYLVDHYFQIEEINTSPRARAIEFLTLDAPQGEPAQQTAFTFGDEVELTGFDLPAGETFTSGDVLPVSLVWGVINAPDFDYNVSLFLMDEQGAVVAQRDGQPQATFGRMSRWEVGQVYRDNYGLRLPTNLPEGTYTLQIVVYNWQTQARLNVTNDTFEPIGDSVLLETIRIQR